MNTLNFKYTKIYKIRAILTIKLLLKLQDFSSV